MLENNTNIPNNSTKNQFMTFNVDRIETELPMFIERIGKKWVSYGTDNLFPQFIAGLFNKSAMSRTALMSKADGTFGQGLKTDSPDTDYLLNRANPKESWNEVLEKVILDYVTFGGFALNIVWSNDGETISEFYHADFSRIRSGIPNPDTDEVDYYFTCHDWGQPKKFIPRAHHSFDPTCALEHPSQILYFFDYEPGALFYPLPSYSGGLNDIQIDIEVSKFHINNLANGLAPSLFISLNNGIPDDIARQEIYDEITMAFRGSDNAGKAFIAFSDDKEHAPEINPIPAANSDYYIQLENRITSRILSAHRITSPLLLGLYKEGGSGLGSNKDEIEVAYAHFMSTVIKPIQKSILKVFNKLMDYKGYPEITLSIEPNKLIEATEDSTAVK